MDHIRRKYMNTSTSEEEKPPEDMSELQELCIVDILTEQEFEQEQEAALAKLRLE